VVGEGQAIFKTTVRVATHEMTCHLKPCRCTQYCFWEKWRRVKRLLAASSSKPPTQRKSFQSLPGVDQSNLTVDIPGRKKKTSSWVKICSA